MATPREIIIANLEQTGAPRLGLTFTGGRVDDMVRCGLGPSAIWTKKIWQEGPFEFYDDEWGNLWKRMIEGCRGGEVETAALADWAHLDNMHLPDFDNPDRLDRPRKAFAENPDKYKVGSMPGWVFATSRYLRKMEIYFADLCMYREEVDRLHTMVTDLLVKVVHGFGSIGADAITFAEDLGVQDRLLIGPAMWRDIYKPHYERLTGAAREYGMKILMHSCGYNFDLVDDLVAAGIDAFQFDQPCNYDLDALSAKFRQHKVALWSPVDIQKVLPTGDRALIEATAQKLADKFSGFFIAKNYGDLHGIGVQPEWDRWAYEAFLRAAGMDPENPEVAG